MLGVVVSGLKQIHVALSSPASERQDVAVFYLKLLSQRLPAGWHVSNHSMQYVAEHHSLWICCNQLTISQTHMPLLSSHLHKGVVDFLSTASQSSNQSAGLFLHCKLRIGRMLWGSSICSHLPELQRTCLMRYQDKPINSHATTACKMLIDQHCLCT